MEPKETNVIMVFIKNPLLGKVKTRLSKTIGNLNALKVYRFLLKHTREIVEEQEACDKLVFYNHFIPVDDEWKSSHFHKFQQPKGEDLGNKMQKAFEIVFNLGYEKAILISADCPKIGSNILSNAFRKLDEVDVVIGPCKDGNYYLIGMNVMQKELFENKVWKNETAYKDTLDDLKRLNLSWFALPELVDVDREEDLESIKHLKIY